MAEDPDFQDVEIALRRHAIAGPPDRLRQRIQALKRGRSRSPRWWLGAAAAFIAAFWLHARASRTLDEVTEPLVASLAAAHQAQVDDIAQALGGGASARRIAEELLRRQE